MGFFKKTDSEIGHKGKTEAVRAKAVADIAYDQKLQLLEGCIKAFDENRPENLRTFLGAYFEFKRKNGSLEKLEQNEMDEGIICLAAKPLLGLIERSKTPAETIETLTCDLSPFYKQLALDITLRQACGKAGSWFVAEAVLEAGADANAGGGRPLVNALRLDHKRITEILYAFGADFDAVPAFAEQSHASKTAALKEKFNGTVASRKPPNKNEIVIAKGNDQPPRKTVVL